MEKTRTRFAPSPTGYMHIGNLRTALYAYLLTKSKNATVYSGLSLAENRTAVEEIGAAAEIPTLQQLSIEILKLYEAKEKERNQA